MMSYRPVRGPDFINNTLFSEESPTEISVSDVSLAERWTGNTVHSHHYTAALSGL